jgi:hypothetical protein
VAYGTATADDVSSPLVSLIFWSIESIQEVQDAVEEKLSAMECGTAMKQYQEICLRYYE